VPAYWHEHGKSILLKSTDGIAGPCFRIHEGDWNDETAIEFLPDGRLLATAAWRARTSWLGDERASTLITTSARVHRVEIRTEPRDPPRRTGPVLV
jgi:hypothetical protein